ncbi:MAG: SLC13 family permease [Bacteroidia bacterium]
MKNILPLLAGPVAALLFASFVTLDAQNVMASRMAAITIWIAIWWLLEVVDIGVSALLPLILLPVCGILDAKATAAQYMDSIIFLFLGGFILALALEKWQLHHRISLMVLQKIGDNPAKILAGMMLTAYFLSAWMSNTATTLMLYPAVLAVYQHVKTVSNKPSIGVAIALLLGLAYAASIGGMATLVGTPTNMIFYSFYSKNIDGGDALTFFTWSKYGVPVSMLMLIFCYAVLRFFYIRKEDNIAFDKSYFADAYKRLGEWSLPQKIVLAVFSITAMLWLTRADIDLGYVKMQGWSNLFANPKIVDDSTVAIFMAFLLFFIPVKSKQAEKEGEQTTLMTWEDAQKIPLNILLLFGAGFALGKGFEVSGLSEWLANILKSLNGLSPTMMVLVICVVICIISEFASNVASIQLALPILLVLCKSLDIPPLVLMIPATLAASLGFMLPVATAPNTIVFSSQLIPVKAMLRAGFWLDVVGIIIITLIAS